MRPGWVCPRECLNPFAMKDSGQYSSNPNLAEPIPNRTTWVKLSGDAG